MKFILLAILIIACKPNSQRAPDEAMPRESGIEETVALDSNKMGSTIEITMSQESEIQPSMADIESRNLPLEPEESREAEASIPDISLDVVEQEQSSDSKHAVDGFFDTNYIEMGVDDSSDHYTPSETGEVGPKKLEVSPVNQISSMHTAFNDVLNEYVDAAGNVDYKGLKSSQPQLDAYLTTLSENPIQSGWSKDEQLAYWINAYNAFTLKLIIDNYPLKSIMDLEGGKVWDKKWINLGDEVYSLNEIENDIIRPEFNEPRIHFAVNCAAASCPPLAAKAFTADNLETLLTERTTSFINNGQYNQISTSGVEVSKIFDWYGSDFGDLISFLNKYSRASIKKNASVDFQEYDWSLNSQ